MFIEAKDDGGGSDNWTTGAIRRAKLQSNHHQQTDIQFFYSPVALPVAKQTVSKHWREKYHSMDLRTPSSPPGVFQLWLWSLIAPGYLGGGLPCHVGHRAKMACPLRPCTTTKQGTHPDASWRRPLIDHVIPGSVHWSKILASQQTSFGKSWLTEWSG